MSDAAGRSGVLPPKGLLVSLLAQTPLAALSWPLRPAAWEVAAGVALLAAGTLLAVWAERLFRRDDVGVCPFTPVPRLVADGPYRVTRNPMYAGFFFLSLAPVLLSGVLANAIVPAIYVVWLHVRFVVPEEAFLRERLGEEYERYLRTRPRWIGIGI